jgi:hypothetical protein
MDILKSLNDSPVVSDFEVDEYRSWTTGRYYKVTVHIDGGNKLFAREYVDQNERCYSFHWQDASGCLISRWDNAPHHSHLTTRPHHRHLGVEIQESQPPSLSDILDIIKDELDTDN